MYKLAHIAIAVEDLHRSEFFYTEVLGCALTDRKEMPNLQLVYLQLGDQTLELLHYSSDPAGKRQTGLYDHIALETEDLDTEMRRLSGLGIAFPPDAPRSTPWGQRIAFFTGPDGERIELVEVDS